MDSALVPTEALAKKPSYNQIRLFEAHLYELPQRELECNHHFFDGYYFRELSIPADTFLTGKTHTTEHWNFLAKGRITVWTEEGMKTLEGPVMVPSQPGCKRVGYTHTDTVWICLHDNPDNERRVEVLEARLIDEPPRLSVDELQLLVSNEAKLLEVKQ